MVDIKNIEKKMKLLKPNDLVILKIALLFMLFLTAVISIVLGATSEDIKQITLTPHLYIPASIIAYYAVAVICIVALMYMTSKIDRK